MKKTKLYIDTSVFGGMFDEEFMAPSRHLFEAIRAEKFRFTTSDVVRKEISDAPEDIRNLFGEMLDRAEIIPITQNALHLRDAYIAAGILTPKWSDDGLHVALATIFGCDIIVSWNFKHIVHYQKIPLYNAVNTLQGYGNIQIYSPLEVIEYGD